MDTVDNDEGLGGDGRVLMLMVLFLLVVPQQTTYYAVVVDVVLEGLIRKGRCAPNLQDTTEK